MIAVTLQPGTAMRSSRRAARVACRRRQQEFGHPVGPGAEVLAAVERGPVVRAREPVVGAAVDDESVGAELSRQLPRLAVRQSEENDVVAGEH